MKKTKQNKTLSIPNKVWSFVWNRITVYSSVYVTENGLNCFRWEGHD